MLSPRSLPEQHGKSHKRHQYNGKILLDHARKESVILSHKDTTWGSFYLSCVLMALKSGRQQYLILGPGGLHPGVRSLGATRGSLDLTPLSMYNIISEAL